MKLGFNLILDTDSNFSAVKRFLPLAVSLILSWVILTFFSTGANFLEPQIWRLGSIVLFVCYLLEEVSDKEDRLELPLRIIWLLIVLGGILLLSFGVKVLLGLSSIVVPTFAVFYGLVFVFELFLGRMGNWKCPIEF